MSSKIDDRLPECYRGTRPRNSIAEWELQHELRQEQWENIFVVWVMAEFWRSEATREYKKGNRKVAAKLRSRADAKAREAQALIDDKRPLIFLKAGR